ncbi:MAG: thiamine-phosphate kinase [Aquificae bacterium]|nr:thiamine-phosphate kinase [Aquificota bacterium]
MRVKDLGEFGLIGRLVKHLQVEDDDVVVAFGDDCSCVKTKEGLLLFTGDAQVEDRHFIRRLTPSQDLGWKLVSVNVSDVVACGGKPKWGFISVAFPQDLPVEYAEGIYRGISQASREYGMSVIGGNTASSDKIVLDLFLTGKTDRFVSRSSAEAGEFLLLSGHTGLARAGLELLLMEKKEYLPFEKKLINAFLRPVARLDLSDRLSRYAGSSIDISDGLVADLYHLSEASGVKLSLTRNKLPVSEELAEFCRREGKDVYDYLLYGGEDYQIAFTVKGENLKHFGDCYPIGKVERGSGVFLDGERLEKKGFTHL